MYDALGSVLFEAICELPWYGITRAEFSLLETHRAAILAHASSSTRLSRIVELGPGNGTKLRTLLEEDTDRLANGGVYGRADRRRRGREVHLIDVSGKALDQAVKALSPLERIEVVRHEATYEDGLREIAEAPDVDGSTLVLFLGSNIGNFDRPGAEEFLRTIRAALKPGDSLLLGADLVKPEADLLLAYDDPLGVTAAFNRNLLVRINRELGGDFDLDAFGHSAVWNAATRAWRCIWSAGGVSACAFRRRTSTSPSRKATRSGPRALTNMDRRSSTPCSSSAGFDPVDCWIAPRERFALLLVRAA